MNHFLREMNNQNRSAIQQQLCELDELYHAAQLSSYENAFENPARHPFRAAFLRSLN